VPSQPPLKAILLEEVQQSVVKETLQSRLIIKFFKASRSSWKDLSHLLIKGIELPIEVYSMAIISKQVNPLNKPGIHLKGMPISMINQ
jgi:hypothetical protein